jgi:hypothetical protein
VSARRTRKRMVGKVEDGERRERERSLRLLLYVLRREWRERDMSSEAEAAA